TPNTEPKRALGHEDWDPKLKIAVAVTGTIDKSGDKDTGYTVEAAIPWTAFSKAAHRPPQNGDTWRMNFYAMKNNGGVAWSPILGQGNFHKSSRFGKVVFMAPDAAMGDAGAKDAAAKPGADAAAAGASGPRILPIPRPTFPPHP